MIVVYCDLFGSISENDSHPLKPNKERANFSHAYM